MFSDVKFYSLKKGCAFGSSTQPVNTPFRGDVPCKGETRCFVFTTMVSFLEKKGWAENQIVFIISLQMDCDIL